MRVRVLSGAPSGKAVHIKHDLALAIGELTMYLSRSSQRFFSDLLLRRLKAMRRIFKAFNNGITKVVGPFC